MVSVEDVVLNIGNFGMIFFWALLVFTPRWKPTQFITRSLVVPSLLALVYVTLLITDMFVPSGGVGGGSFFSIKGIQNMNTSRLVTLLSWYHFLCWDFVVGVAMSEDSIRNGLPRLCVAPCLALVFLYGPTGGLCYVLFRVSYLSRRRAKAKQLQEDQGTGSGQTGVDQDLEKQANAVSPVNFSPVYFYPLQPSLTFSVLWLGRCSSTSASATDTTASLV
mmetsp:Transcript_3854/g.7382  ORF Transcript_3854/g.7382 Transcript_3854/m.7382 type:complete len:220 (+) Transcript_3854:48-707(+)